MKQISQNYRSGEVRLEDVASPTLRRGGLLVAAEYSAVSIGTEGMKVREARMSYLGMARARPDQVKKVLQSVRQQGIRTTYDKVMNRLDSLTPLGYSLCGVVIEVGDDVTGFHVGQRVACAGGTANHSEIVSVTRNLCVPVPDGVLPEHAAFTTVGAIAMHGYRQAEMQLGESACVIGLGLLGQILTQILQAAGISVIGVDILEDRCRLATGHGAAAVFKADDANLVTSVLRATGNRGADCIFITASGMSNAPVELAVRIARDRARVVDIGKTRLDLPWNDYYLKELDVRFSRSYGPGRYDHSYEDDGVDYPLGYVRWTERRNMESFLELLNRKAVKMSGLITEVVPFGQAEQLYQSLESRRDSVMGIVFDYNLSDGQALDRRTAVWPAGGQEAAARNRGESISLGIIGAGNYASSMLLPHLRTDGRVKLRLVATTSSLTSKNAALKFGIEKATTDYHNVIADDEIEAVLIATRHASHSIMVCEALRAGKAVYVEKPLAINWHGLSDIVAAVNESGNDRIMVGFNRRFSSLVTSMREIVAGVNPVSLMYRVHAGAIDPGSWYQDTAHGSRFVGEAGHFVDVMSFLSGARPTSVFARSLTPSRSVKDDSDNLIVMISYDNGSVGTLLYLTQGGHKTPKEHIEVYGGGRTCILRNFERLEEFEGDRSSVRKSRSIDKGQKAQMAAVVESLMAGRAMPIPLQTLLDTTAVTLAAEQSARTGAPITLQDLDFAKEPDTASAGAA